MLFRSHFIREFNDWEMDEGLLFLRILGANTSPMEAGDRMRWKLKPNRVFDIQLYYNKLRDSPSTVFPWKAIWRVKAPRGVYGCGLWRGIHMGWEDFSKNCQFVVGLGNRVRFW